MADRLRADAPTRTKAKAAERSAFEFDKQSDESIGSLLRHLVDQGAHLAEKQSELIRAEVQSSVTDIKEAGGAMAGAAVLGLAAIGVTLMGVAYLLATAIPLWAATLIVGLAALAGAYALLVTGQNKLQSKSMTVERTRHTLERAPGAITGDAKKGARK